MGSPDKSPEGCVAQEEVTQCDETAGPPLSKSRFLAGLQCHKRLWWQVYEPDTRKPVVTEVKVARLAIVSTFVEVSA